MGQYRVELASTGRSGCKDSHCQANGIKIEKGELRFATQVTINERTSWTYKHWGCVTPRVIANLSESIEENLEYLDGYDELPEDLQGKVAEALAEGHVDDADWKGDPEFNRVGMQGTRPRTPKKKKQTDKDGDEDVDRTPTKPATKKRSRVKDEADDGDAAVEAPAKKTKSRAKKANLKDEDDAVAEEPEKPVPVRKANTGKKLQKTVIEMGLDEQVGNEQAETKPSKGARKGKAANVKAEAIAGGQNESTQAVKAAPKKGRKAAEPENSTNAQNDNVKAPKKGHKRAEPKSDDPKAATRKGTESKKSASKAGQAK